MDENNTEALEREHDQVVLQWKTPEFIPHPRGARWFLFAGTLILALTAYAILTGSATMAIVFILLGGVYYLTHNQNPKIIDIKITQLGILIGNKFHAYNTINSFWIVYRPPYVTKLYLKLATKSATEIKVELSHQDPVKLRHVLGKEIPEIEGGEERLDDIFIRLLRLQ